MCKGTTCTCQCCLYSPHGSNQISYVSYSETFYLASGGLYKPKYSHRIGGSTLAISAQCPTLVGKFIHVHVGTFLRTHTHKHTHTHTQTHTHTHTHTHIHIHTHIHTHHKQCVRIARIYTLLSALRSTRSTRCS